MIVGPAIAGVLLALTGPGEAIAIDAATFVASASVLARLRPAEIAAAEPRRPAKRMLDSSSRGLADRARQRLDPAGPGGLVAYHLFVLPSVFVLGPAIAEQELERGDELGGDLDRLRRRRGARERRRAEGAGRRARCSWPRGALVLASLQSAFLGSGLGTRRDRAARAGRGHRRVDLLHALGLTVQEQVPPRTRRRACAPTTAPSSGYAARLALRARSPTRSGCTPRSCCSAGWGCSRRCCGSRRRRSGRSGGPSRSPRRAPPLGRLAPREALVP